MKKMNIKLPIILRNYNTYLMDTKEASELTIKNYNADLIMLFRFIKMKKDKITNKKIEEIKIAGIREPFVKSITEEDLNDFIGYLKNERGNSANSRVRRIASIKMFYLYLKKKKIVDKNIALDLERPKVEKRQPIYLNYEEQEKFINAIKNEIDKENHLRDYTIIALELSTGLRVSELSKLNIDSIVIDRFNGQKKGTLSVIGKGNKQRIIPMSESILNKIEEYLKFRTKMASIKEDEYGNPLFISRLNKRVGVQTIQKIVRDIIKKTDIKKHITVHKLRHTVATNLHLNGTPIIELAEILGHEQISTTQIYTHTNNEAKTKAVNNNPVNDML